MERFFHAPGRGAYFEGWYFKLQTRGGEALALIPALHQDAALRRSASLQVITREGSWWLEYPEAEFGASAERLRIRAGANIFTEKGLRVSADAPGLRLRGAVGFGAFTRLVSDIMGPFRFLPGMECSHGVISMTHALEGAQSAVELCLAMCGVMCLWTGVMEVMNQCHLTDRLASLFRPLLKRLLPNASRDSETLAAISANLSADLLGLGNAATPLGIRAACRMSRGCKGIASDELCLLVVLNTASIQLLPTTLAGVRASLGAADPFDILPAVWLTSLLSVLAGLFAAKLFAHFWRN